MAMSPPLEKRFPVGGGILRPVTTEKQCPGHLGAPEGAYSGVSAWAPSSKRPACSGQKVPVVKAHPLSRAQGFF
jgi:hypothetical protein